MQRVLYCRAVAPCMQQSQQLSISPLVWQRGVAYPAADSSIIPHNCKSQSHRAPIQL